jgi:hypothetical protein
MLILMWVSRGSTIALGVAGTSELYPIPPSLWQVMYALFIFCVSSIPLLMGEFFAAYLKSLQSILKSPLPEDVKQRQINGLRSSTFAVFPSAASAITQLYKATLGRFPCRPDREEH